MLCPKCKRQVLGDICPDCGYKSAFKKMDDLGGAATESPAAVPAVSAPIIPDQDKPAAGGFKPMGSLGGEVKKPQVTVHQEIPASGGFKPMDVLPGGERETVDNEKEETLAVKYTKGINWKRLFPVAATIVAVLLVVIVVFAGGKTSKEVQRINNEISSVENVFLNGQEYIALDEKDELLSDVYQAVNQIDEVVYCEKGDYEVYMVLDNGIGMHYQAPISDLASNGAELEVYTYQPHYDEFTDSTLKLKDLGGSLGDKKGEYPDKAVDQLEKLDITANKANRFYNKEVTLELLKQNQQNSVIVWIGHGGYSTDTHSTLLLTVEFTDALYRKYKDDFDNHRLEVVHSSPVNTICVTPAFFDYYLDDDALENSIIYLGSCHSGHDDVLISTLLGKGAATVYWNSDAIFQQYNNKMCRSVMDALCDGATTGNALTIAQNANGALDNVLLGLIKKNVWVGCSGNQHITLKDLYNKANDQLIEEEIPATEPTQVDPTAETESSKTWPTQQELFSGSCWVLAAGPTLGTQYVYKFYENGDCIGYNIGNGQKFYGAYTYDSGVLDFDGEIFDLTKDGSFKSRDSHYNGQHGSEVYSELRPGGEDMWNQYSAADNAKETWEEDYTPPEPPEQLFGVWYYYTNEGGTDMAWCVSFNPDGTFVASCGQAWTDFFYEYVSGSWWYVYEVEDYTFSITLEDSDLGSVTIRVAFDGEEMDVYAISDGAEELPICYETGYYKEFDC